MTIEQRIIDAMNAQPQKEWTIPELGAVAYKGRERPSNWKNSIVAIMRTIISRTESSIVRVKRTSNLGRGNKAIYGIEVRRTR
jgi:hypothetical protein